MLEKAPASVVLSAGSGRGRGGELRAKLQWALGLGFGGGDKGVTIICEDTYSAWCVRVGVLLMALASSCCIFFVSGFVFLVGFFFFPLLFFFSVFLNEQKPEICCNSLSFYWQVAISPLFRRIPVHSWPQLPGAFKVRRESFHEYTSEICD